MKRIYADTIHESVVFSQSTGGLLRQLMVKWSIPSRVYLKYGISVPDIDEHFISGQTFN